jgi:hemoglobin
MASTYDTMGGAPAVATAVDELYDRVLGDAQLAPFFVDADQLSLRAHQREFLTIVLGGPGHYEGRKLHDAHAGRGISDVHFDLFVGHLADTLTDIGVDPTELETIIGQVAVLRSEIVGP